MNRMRRTSQTHDRTERTERPAQVPRAEGLPDMEALVRGWEVLLINRARPFAVQQDDGTYRWVFRVLDRAALRAHLSGTHTLALSSLDEAGRCRWVCLDADAPDGLAQLALVRESLAALGLPALLEASRRGGHLWLLLDAPTPAALARAVVGAALDDLVAGGTLARLPERYPDTDGTDPARLGHAVRLPLGVHRRTGQHYPLLDGAGVPLPLRTPRELAAQMAHLLAHPRISGGQLRAAAARLCVPVWKGEGIRVGDGVHGGAVPEPGLPAGADRRRTTAFLGRNEQATTTTTLEPSGTTSAVIRWVDAQVSPLDLLDELYPESEMRVAGQGFLGWCPFHDDRAPDEHGGPGTPSFYVVYNRRYGWSWRCLSTQCGFSEGPMKHSFRLLQELLRVDARAAIEEALARWGGAMDEEGGEEGASEPPEAGPRGGGVRRRGRCALRGTGSEPIAVRVRAAVALVVLVVLKALVALVTISGAS